MACGLYSHLQLFTTQWGVTTSKPQVTVPCKSIHLPWHFFCFLLPHSQEFKWIVWGIASFHFQNMWFLFYCDANNKYLKISENSSVHNYSPPKVSTLSQPTSAAIIAASHFGQVSMSLPHLATEIFAHSSKQNCSSSFKFGGFHLWTAIFKSDHRFSVKVWALTRLFQHLQMFPLKPLKCCFCSTLRVIVLLEGEPPSQSQSLADGNRFCSRMSLYSAPSIFSSILTFTFP